MAISNKDIKVLVVDDDEQYANSICSALSSLGYEAVACYSSKKAEYIIRQQQFHILIIDCLLPETNGYVLSRKIRDIFSSSLGIILMSGVFKKHMLPGVEKLPLIKKPFQDAELKSVLEKVQNKLFYSDASSTLFSDILNPDLTLFSLQKKIHQYKSIHGIEAVLFLFMAIQSKEQMAFKITSSSHTAHISISDGKIVNYYDDTNTEDLSEFLLENELLKPNEMNPFKDMKYKDLVENIVNSSLVSPHHILRYALKKMIFDLNHFIFQEKVQITTLPFKYSFVHIQTDEVLNVFNNLLDKDISIQFLKNMLSFYNNNHILINEEKRKEWTTSSISLLQILDKHLEQMNKLSLNQFLDLYSSDSEKNSVLRALFWLISQGYLNFSRSDLSHTELDRVCEKRYAALVNIMEGLDQDGIFHFLGCEDVFNTEEVQKVYNHFIRVNHVDKYSHYSEQTQHLIDKVNQLVNSSYSFFENQIEAEKYKKDMRMKNTHMSIEVASIQKQIFSSMRLCEYSKARDLVQSLNKYKTLGVEIEKEAQLWNFVLEMEDNKRKTSRQRAQEMMDELNRMKKVKTIFGHPLYHYTMGFIALCKNNGDYANTCFNKALEIDPEFHLAKVKKLDISNKGFSFLKKKAG